MSLGELDDELGIDARLTHISEAHATDSEVPGDDHGGEVTAEGDVFDLSDRSPADNPDIVRRLLLDGLSQSEVGDRFDCSAGEIGRVARADRTSGYDCKIPPLSYDDDAGEYQTVEDADVEAIDDVDQERDGETSESPVADDLELLSEEVRRVEKATSGVVDVAITPDSGPQIVISYGVGE